MANLITQDNQHQVMVHVVDLVSIVTVTGTLLKMLPDIAALFTIVWTGIRIWESDSVKRWTGRA